MIMGFVTIVPGCLVGSTVGMVSHIWRICVKLWVFEKSYGIFLEDVGIGVPFYENL